MKALFSGPAANGALMALLAALLFGASTPLLQRTGDQAGPFFTAALLYLGAVLTGLFSIKGNQREAGLKKSDALRLGLMGLTGAAIGPVALAWGLQHSSGSSASLLLTLEVVFTALLARIFYNESMDRRIWLAVLLLIAGSTFLILDGNAAGRDSMSGLAAILLATLAWGADNTLSRELADRDPSRVLVAKGTIGALMTGMCAVVAQDALGGAGPMCSLCC